MQLCRSKEAAEEIRSIAALDRDIGTALEACIEMLAIDANEFEGQEGFSVRRIGSAFRRGIRLYRVKYEKYMPSLRILFFSIPAKNCVFITGVHPRADLEDYSLSRSPISRAIRYWGLRENLC
jgi:hypothetical protein